MSSECRCARFLSHVLVLFFGAGVCGDALAETCVTREQAAPSIVSRADALRKLEPVWFLLDLPPIECFDETTIVTPRPDDAFPGIEVKNKRGDFGFTVDDSGQSLRLFSVRLPRVPAGVERTAVIDVNSIVPRANAFLERVGVDMQVTAKDFLLDESMHMTSSPMLGVQWVGARLYTYEGAFVFNATVALMFSAYTGRVTYFSHRPPTEIPASMEVRISSEEVAVRANEWVRSHTLGIQDPLDVKEPRQWIIGPSFRKSLHPRFTGTHEELLNEPRLVWRIGFAPVSGKAKTPTKPFGDLYYDCQTGELVGVQAAGVKPDLPPDNAKKKNGRRRHQESQ